MALLVVAVSLGLTGFGQSAGYALDFDGVNNYLRVGSTTSVMQGDGWVGTKTLSVWVKPSTSEGPAVRPETGQLILGNDRPRSFGISRALWDGQDRIWAFNADSDGVDFVGVTVTPGEWTQITVVHADGFLRIYRNGTEVDSVPSGPTLTLNGSAVGTLYMGGSDSSRTRHFSGQLDEARLWNTGQDAATVLDWVNRPVDASHPQWSSLVAYYQMVDGSGTSVSDQSSFGTEATLFGGMGDQSWVPSGAFGGTPNSAPVAEAQTVVTPEDTSVGIQLSGSDLDGDPLTYLVVTGPASGQLSGQAPDLVYTPSADFNGSDSFWFKVNDGLADSSEAQVTISVTAVNDPPLAADDTALTSEGVPVTIDVLANDSDVDGDPLTVSLVGAAVGGSVENLGDAVRYTPGPGFTGDDGFSYTISDGQGGISVADVTVTVSGVNQPPAATAQGVTTAEDTPITITLSGSDPDGDGLTYQVVTGPTSGQLSGQAPNLVYAPAADFNGSDNFWFSVNDGVADSPQAQVTITVTPVNDPPVAADDVAVTTEGVAVTVDVLANDVDVDGNALTIVTVGTPVSGTVENLGDSIRYTPGAVGQDGFDYTVSDGNGGTGTAHVTVTVNSQSSLAGDALEFDGSTDFVQLAETSVMMPAGWQANKTVSLWVLPLGPAQSCTGAAVCDAVFGDRPRWWGISRGIVGGADKLWIWNYDGNADVIAVDYSEGEWVHLSLVHSDGLLRAFKNGVEVGSIPSGPTLQPNTGASPVLQIGGVISSANFTFHGQVDEVSIWSRGRTAEEIAGDFHGILSGGEVGLVAYYRMSDGSGTTLTDDSGHGWDGTLNDGGPNVPPDGQPAQWVASTAPITHPPTADPLSILTEEDTPAAITLSGSDPDGQPLSYEVVSGPSAGQLTGVAPDLTYQPAADFNGSDSFSFKVNDGLADSLPAVVSIIVTPVNDPPVAVGDSGATSENTALILSVLANDFDVDADALTISSVGNASAGTVENLGTAVRYTPLAGFSGTDGFSYTVADGQGGFASADVEVTVAGVNVPPTADSASVSTAEDTSIGITLTGSDPDGDPLSFVLVSSPANGLLSGQAPNLIYTPVSNFNGSDSLRFKVNDGLADSADALVSITVTPVNDPPVALDDTGVTPIETPLVVSVLANDTDVDGDSLTVTAAGPAANGTVENLGDSIRYTPAAGFEGGDSFDYTVSDGNGGTATALVQVTVANQLILQETGFLLMPGDAWNVTVEGGLAYVADSSAGLRIVDVSDPANPVEIGALDTTGRTYDVQVLDNLAYVADGRDGLKIVDISDPFAPVEVGAVDTPDLAWSVAVELPYVFVADRDGGLRIIDASDPAQPVEVGSLDTPGQAVDVLVRGNVAYIADFSGGLRIADVSDKANPTDVGAMQLASAPYGLAADGNFLYVADGQDGLHILDISVPADPVEVSSQSTSGLARNVALMGGFAFVTADVAGLHVIDVFDPLQPVWTATVDTPGRVRGVAAAAGYAYIADHEGGLRIVRVY